jgi:hypothetical protein
LPLVLMLNGGGRSFEDLRQIRDDEGFREVLELKRMPSAGATGDWLRRGEVSGGLGGLGAVNRRVRKRALKAEGIKGYTGYMPMVGHLAENEAKTIRLSQAQQRSGHGCKERACGRDCTFAEAATAQIRQGGV